MSALTKVFVVLLVILSLLLAAASITFLHTVPDYNAQIEILKSGEAAARAQAARVSAAESASRAALEQQAAELRNSLADADAAVTSARTELARAEADIAALESQLAQANATQSTLSSAVSANMALVNTLRDEVASLREQYDRTVDQNMDLTTNYARVSNELEYVQRALRAAEEENKDAMGQITRLEGMVVALGGDPRSNQTPVAPPPINGVIIQRMKIGDQPFALISVGSEDDVKPGMRFNVIDAETDQLLGFVTVEEVDDQVSVGKLSGVSGPSLEQIAPNDEVRTQV